MNEGEPITRAEGPAQEPCLKDCEITTRIVGKGVYDKDGKSVGLIVGLVLEDESMSARVEIYDTRILNAAARGKIHRLTLGWENPE